MKFNISKFIRDECLRTIAVHILSLVYEGGKTTKKELHAKMFDLYHGKPGTRTICHKKAFVDGQGIFEHLWEVDADLDAHVLIQKYHRSNKILVRDDGINANVLEVKSFNSKELVIGRSLHDQAMTCLCEMKKACAFVKDHLDDVGNPKASGDTVESIVNRLLDFMWSEQKKTNSPPAPQDQPPSKKQKVEKGDTAISTFGRDARAISPSPASTNTSLDLSDDEGDDDVVTLVNQRPIGWTFKGYMAFMYFGPFSENRDANRFIELLKLTDPPKEDSKKYGRKTQREQTAKAEAFDRKRESNRGLSPLERVLVATQVNKRCSDERARIEGALMSLNARASRNLGFVQLEFERAKETKDWSGYDRLNKLAAEMESQIVVLEGKLLAVCKKADNVNDDSSESNVEEVVL